MDLGEKESQPANTVQGQMELRVKVAELCGWTGFELYPNDLYAWTAKKQGREAAWLDKNGLGLYPVPDFPTDLNAISEAEKLITADLQLEHNARTRYEKEVGRILREKFEIDETAFMPPWYFLRATAEERCRAFVKTMEAPSVEPQGTKSDSASGVLQNP